MLEFNENNQFYVSKILRRHNKTKTKQNNKRRFDQKMS